MPDQLLYAVAVLAIAGVILWALTQFPIDATIAKLIKVVVVVFAVIYLIHVLLGLSSGSPAPHRLL